MNTSSISRASATKPPSPTIDGRTRKENRMKDKKFIDKSAPYRSMGLGKITAPNTQKDQPKATKTVGKDDLRGGKRQ